MEILILEISRIAITTLGIGTEVPTVEISTIAQTLGITVL